MNCFSEDREPTELTASAVAASAVLEARTAITIAVRYSVLMAMVPFVGPPHKLTGTLRNGSSGYDRQKSFGSAGSLQVPSALWWRQGTKNEAVPIKPTVAFMAKLPAPQDPYLTEAALELDHCRAICAEIGERLQHSLAQDTSPVPTRLRKLINRLADLEGSAPPFISDCDDEPTARARPKRGPRWFPWKRDGQSGTRDRAIRGYPPWRSQATRRTSAT